MLHSHTWPLPGSVPEAQSTKQARRTLKANEPLPAIPTLLEQILAARKASRAAAWADEDEGHYGDHDMWLVDD